MTRVGKTIVVCAVAVLAGCSTVSLKSSYRDHAISVDGSYSDWKKIEFKEPLGVSVGVTNDDEFMYAIIVVRDNELQRRIFLNGMILWFDPSGEKKEQFGIRYPMKLPPDPSEVRSQLRPRPTPEELAEKRRKMLAEYEVIADGGRLRKVSGVSIPEVPGVEVRSGGPNGMNVFEYKIPLRRTDATPFAIGCDPGAIIGVGLVTPEFQHEAMDDEMGANGRAPEGLGTAGGGRYSRGTGNMGTRRGTQPMSMARPLNVWGTLTLSSN